MDTEPTCSVCHREGVKLYARGLCRTHYLADLKRRREGGDEGMADSDVGTGGDVLGEGDALSVVLGDFPATRSPQPSTVTSPYLESSPPVETRPGGVGAPSSPPDASGPELTPSAPDSKIRRFFSKKERPVPSPSSLPPATKEKRPGGGRSGRRESAAETIADGWAALGGVAIRTGTHAPLGRCLQWQAPMAGEMLDDVVKGTLVDKMVLQKAVKGRQRFDLLGAVIGPPLLVLAIERNPENAATLMPLLASSIRHSLPHMVPAIKKAKAREAKIAEATAELFADDPTFREGDDPVAYILGMMFDGWVVPEPAPEPQEVPDMYAETPVP